MFARLGSWCFRKRRRVAVLWVLAVLVVGGISSGIGGNFGQDFEPPGFESTRGLDVLENEFDDQVGSGTQGTIVFRAEQGVDDPAVQESMEQLFTMVQTIADDPDVDVASDPAFAHLDDDALQVLEDADLSTWEGITIASPYDDPTGRQISSQGDNAGLIAYANLEIPGDDWEEAGTIGRTLEQVLPTVDGVQVELGGAALGEFEEPSTEALGLAFAIVILVLAFGSVLAMGLPVGVALAGIFAGSVIVTILSNLLVMPDFAPFLGGMIGLGVGIDYALFIVTRYRENLHHGHTPEEATSIAIDTAGPRRGLRGRHRRRVVPRHGGDGHQLHPGPGRQRRRRRGHDRGRFAHAAPRPARLRRAPGRGHALARRRRHRLPGPRSDRRGPQDRSPRRVSGSCSPCSRSWPGSWCRR